jgi:hypothetical protein
MGKMSFNGGCDEGEDVATLLATTLDHRQHRLDETAAAGALRSKRQLPPYHRVTQRPLASVVRRLDPFMPQKRPQPLDALASAVGPPLPHTTAAMPPSLGFGFSPSAPGSTAGPRACRGNRPSVACSDDRRPSARPSTPSTAAPTSPAARRQAVPRRSSRRSRDTSTDGVGILSPLA